MIIKDRGVILKIRPFQDNDAIVVCLSHSNGIIAGMVKKYRSSKQMRSVVEVGHYVEIEKYAKEGALGRLSLECITPFAYNNLHSNFRLQNIINACTAVKQLVSEDNENNLCSEALQHLLNFFAKINDHSYATSDINKFFLIFMANIIKICGYGMHFDRCHSGQQGCDNLVYVSPNSLNAISETAGQPYASKMLPLPDFLRDLNARCGADCLADGARLIKFACQKIFFEHIHQKLDTNILYFLESIITKNS